VSVTISNPSGSGACDAPVHDRTFDRAIGECGLWPLTAGSVETLQINVGRLCNQGCRHCHWDAGPTRTEVMSKRIFMACLAALDKSGTVTTVDLTGGAPELNPHFRWFVTECRQRGLRVIDRCNLTVLLEPGQEDTVQFLASERVEIAASLPHLREPNSDRQRGVGTFRKSIEAFRKLNDVGYGDGRSGLRLVLVTNPGGAYLPGSQKSLESEWKRELERLYGLHFDALHCLTNMPLGRFRLWLESSGNLALYLDRLVDAFNPKAAANVMCRHLVSVGWDGRLFDCDFNQALEIPLDKSVSSTITDFDARGLAGRRIMTGDHCFGCTAGCGSSCRGTVA